MSLDRIKLLQDLLRLIVSSPHEPSQWGRCKTPIICGQLLEDCESQWIASGGTLPKVRNKTADKSLDAEPNK